MPDQSPEPKPSHSASDPKSNGGKPRPAWAKAFDKDAQPEAEPAGLPKSRIALYAIILGLGLIFWRKVGSSDPPPAVESPASKKAKQSTQGSAAAKTDSLRAKRAALAAARRAAAAASDSGGTGYSGLATAYADDAQAPEDLAAYEFVRTPWENPQSPSLAERVNRLDQGYDRHP